MSAAKKNSKTSQKPKLTAARAKKVAVAAKKELAKRKQESPADYAKLLELVRKNRMGSFGKTDAPGVSVSQTFRKKA